MNEKLNELLSIVGCDLVTNHSMTIDEILECIHCTVDEDGEVIDMDTGKRTGIWYDDLIKY